LAYGFLVVLYCRDSDVATLVRTTTVTSAIAGTSADLKVARTPMKSLIAYVEPRSAVSRLRGDWRRGGFGSAGGGGGAGKYAGG
jgi:hypothetical protein